MILYHYTSGHGMYGILNSGELHCSHVNFMNDPSEDVYFDQVLEHVFKNSRDSKKIYDEMYNRSYINAIVEPFDRYVVSFSKNEDSLSMWNYYATGNGYNIGMDITGINEDVGDSALSMQSVELIYSSEAQIKKTIDLITGFEESYREVLRLRNKMKNSSTPDEYYELGFHEMNLEGKFNTGLHTLRLSMKHPAYEREEEIRLIISEDKFHQQTTKFKVSQNGVFVEYLPVPFNLSSRVRSITVHPLNGELHLQSIKKFISANRHLSQAQCKLSSIPFRLI